MKMKLLSVLLLMLFASCGSNSSPEGRLNDKIKGDAKSDRLAKNTK